MHTTILAMWLAVSGVYVQQIDCGGRGHNCFNNKTVAANVRGILKHVDDQADIVHYTVTPINAGAEQYVPVNGIKNSYHALSVTRKLLITVVYKDRPAGAAQEETNSEAKKDAK